MAQSKKKWVAFKSNTTVPGSVLGEGSDQKMQVGKPIQLPEAYANHVVQDGFAAFCDPPKKVTTKKPAPKKPSVQLDEEKNAEAVAKLKAAEERVDELCGKLADVSDDEAQCEALCAELEQAEAELAALQNAS